MKLNPDLFLLSPFLTLIPLLAQSFLQAQFMPKVGLGSPKAPIVLLYSEHFGLCRIRRYREKESPKYNAVKYDTPKNTKNAKQSQIVFETSIMGS